MSTPGIVSAPNIAHTFCATCDKELDADGRTVWVVDPHGWSNVCCSPECADAEAYAMADLNPGVDYEPKEAK